MKKQIRRKFSAAFKAEVAMVAAKNQQTLAELDKKFEVNPVMISKWEAEFLENLSITFKREESARQQYQDTEKLYASIGQLKVENEFFKKKLQETGDRDLGAQLVQPRVLKILVRKKCELLSINRSQLYYKPAPEKPQNIKMMNIMDLHLTKHPTEGVKSMVYLLTAMGFIAGPKRIRRLFRIMCRHAIYRRKNLTKSGLREFIKPYLLKGIKITHANQVWCIDITYIPMKRVLCT